MKWDLSAQDLSTLDCTIDKYAGFYNLSGSMNDEPYTKFSGLEKGGLKYSFKNLDTANPKALIGDAVGLQEAEMTKIADTDTAIQLARTWGTDNSGIELYTIYKKTGFFSYSKSGEMFLLGAVANTGFGTCF